MFWPCRAVQSNDIHLQPNKGGHHCCNIGSQEHASARIERDLSLNWDITSDLSHSMSNASNGRSHLQDVLACFDEQNIDTALSECSSLFSIYLDTLLISYIANHRISR